MQIATPIAVAAWRPALKIAAPELESAEEIAENIEVRVAICVVATGIRSAWNGRESVGIITFTT